MKMFLANLLIYAKIDREKVYFYYIDSVFENIRGKFYEESDL